MKPDNPLICFPPGTHSAKYLRREKRFLVEVETKTDRFWVHCNNSGSMMGLLRPGSPVLISPAPRLGRRLPFTLESIQVESIWVGVNTQTPNRLLEKAWKTGSLPEASNYEYFKREAVFGASRLDALLQGPRGALWVEAKNVTLVEDNVAYFPDAVTVRGQKHLRELMELASTGARVACFCVVQRPDAHCFAPADFIDPVFSALFWEAVQAGVEIWAYEATLSEKGIGLGRRLPLRAP